jgi:hypothetical protein
MKRLPRIPKNEWQGALNSMRLECSKLLIQLLNNHLENIKVNTPGLSPVEISLIETNFIVAVYRVRRESCCVGLVKDIRCVAEDFKLNRQAQLGLELKMFAFAIEARLNKNH